MVCSKYKFCEGCADTTNENGELTCPSAFNPFSEKCAKHERFMAFEEKKRPVDKHRFR
jgi:hypothetical protein